MQSAWCLINLINNVEISMWFRTAATVVKEGSGATAIEYGLIAALVSVAAIGALTAMGVC